MNCGEKICALRKKRGMTQAELGTELNVTFQAVSKWERGESYPDFETMSRIARLFSVPLEYFADGGEEKKEAEESEAEAEKERKLLGICRNCGKAVYEGEEAQKEPHLICKPCDVRMREEKKKAAEKEEALNRAKAEAAENARKEKRSENLKYANRGLIWSAVIMAPVLVLCIISIASSESAADLRDSLLGTLVIMVCGYTFVAQLFYDGIVRAVTLVGGKIVGMPGVIFSLDLDGIIFLVVVKILFAIIKMIIFIVTLLIVVLFALLMAPFTFVPQYIKARRGGFDDCNENML